MLMELAKSVAVNLAGDLIVKILTVIFSGGSLFFAWKANTNAKKALEVQYLSSQSLREFRHLVNEIGQNVIVRPLDYDHKLAQKKISDAQYAFQNSEGYKSVASAEAFHRPYRNFSQSLQRLMSLSSAENVKNANADIKSERRNLSNYAEEITDYLLGGPMPQNWKQALNSVLTDHRSGSKFLGGAKRRGL